MEQRNTITGIVVCGGQSARMGADKSLLVYHDRPQWQYVSGMLSGRCATVWLSVHEGQAALLPPGLPLLTDLPEYRQAGPMAALLTASALLPGHNFLLIGCDYPLLREETLEGFLRSIHQAQPAAFYNEAAQVYEPLLAYYPADVAAMAHSRFAQGKTSLQALLKEQQAARYIPADAEYLASVDTQEQYRAAKAITNGPGFKKEG